MNRTPAFSIALIMGLATAASAEPLQGSAITEAISGKRVTLVTMGLQFPLVYNRDGTVAGDGSAVGLSRYFNPTETGSWWIDSDRLCQKFPTWYKGKTWCFGLEAECANRLRWRRDDGFSGKAVISG